VIRENEKITNVNLIWVIIFGLDSTRTVL
jgi:hypothetical protein